MGSSCIYPVSVIFLSLLRFFIKLIVRIFILKMNINNEALFKK
ncbi:hypothetical protein AcetOrient_orf02901 [Acetobacter orientalis]|uniref:Uncharacterized protein n=1 Tax=Acetobacter orientalis TaxID=146474 RepID=A0A2Z5ZI55_9PROT|nr:hypothetical protein AcetOrient_orf02901 [Acetobacter orientalis]